MRPFWLPVIATPLEDVGSAVCIISVDFQDDFQVQRSECQQQYSYVSTLVESVLDLRRSAKVLSAAVWTPDDRHNDGDAGHHCDYYDYSAESREARGAAGF